MNTINSGDFILRHAVNNIWSLPDQDKPIYIKPARISGPGGEYVRFSYLLNTIALPDIGRSFVVYQIGQIHPKLLNLSEESFKKWINLNEICHCENILVDVFTESGLIVPRDVCYYRVTADRNVLIAVGVTNAVSNVNLETEQICLRIYANSHYRVQSRNNTDPKALIFGGGVISSTYSAGDMQREIYDAIAPYPTGLLVCSVNGYYVENISPVTAKISDYADWYFDSTIYQQIDYDVSALKQYKSDVDGLDKYILNHNANVTSIEHIDDIDFYVVIKSNRPTYGLPIHQYKTGVVVMLTHRDYAIAVNEVNNLLTRMGIVPEDGTVFIRALFRKSRASRPLIHEASRIKQLYKLDYAKRRNAMAGISGPDVWKAVNLEKAGYIKLMTANYSVVSRKTVQDAYGYHALSKILGDTPSKPRIFSGQRVVDVPIGLQQSCTGYEYDSNGKLLHVAFNGADTLYRCTNKNTAWVELVFGEGSASIDLVTHTNTAIYDSKYNYRFYHNVENKWMDVSDTESVSINTNIWSMTGQPTDCAVLSNKRHLFAKFKVQANNGVLTFKLTHRVNNRMVELPFSFGEYDIFLNDHPLIEGVDFVIDFPNVYVTSKEYINQPEGATQHITVRGMNFCNADMSHRKPEEVGFIKGGVLSRNSKNELRDDRVLSIYCGGAFYDRSELSMDEDSPNVLIDSGNEGKPYAINHLIVPMSNFLVNDRAPIDTTEKLRKDALLIDAEINTYLNSLQQASALALPETHHVHVLYSPFFSRIITDLENQYFWDERFKDGGYIDDGEIESLVDYYLPLLNKDLVQVTDADFIKYTKIEPIYGSRIHILGIHQKDLLDRIVTKYGNNRINLDGYVEIKL